MEHIVSPLTHCKTATCGEAITTSDVVREQPVDGSPQHMVIVYKCPSCGRTDRMVGTTASWEEFQKEELSAKNKDIAEDNRIVRGAEIEMNAISSVEDLATLWRSYPRPPLREAVMNSCQCKDCKNRRTI